MSMSIGAYFCRPRDEKGVKWLQERYEIGQPKNRFTLVFARGFDSPDLEVLEKISVNGGEAIFLGVHAVSSCFAFEHWLDGKALRSLNHNGDLGWTVAKGDPEPWEGAVFFKDSWLDEAEEAVNSMEGDERESGEKFIKALKETGRIQEGFRMPLLDEQWAAMVISHYFFFHIPTSY